jgi:hypothetical protein
MDWDCRDDFVMDAIINNPDDLPCELGDEYCWVEVFTACPPCAWEDEGCWKSFDERYGVSDALEKKKDGKKKMDDKKGEKGGDRGDGPRDESADGSAPTHKGAFLAKVSLRAEGSHIMSNLIKGGHDHGPRGARSRFFKRGNPARDRRHH